MKIDSLYTAFLKTTSVSTDSRTVEKGALFFALKGPRFNGNQFAEEALEKGAKYIVVEQSSGLKKNDRIVFVKNPLITLQQLAKYHRKKMKLPIIAITGSNGKTTTKELIREVLSKKYSVLATKGNFNNHIGVPLTLLQLKKYHEIGIIEMGANHLQEIQTLCEIAQPDWGYITNFGKAHLEGFGSEEGVIKGKSELYQYLIKNQGKIVVNGNDSKQVKLTKGHKPIVFGNQENYCFYISTQDTKSNRLILKFKEHLFSSPLHGIYNLNNLAASITFGALFDVPLSHIQEAIKAYKSTNNRSQKINIKGIQFILDAYNANPSSMESALDSFSRIDPKKSAVVLGDMLELGDYSKQAHEKILEDSLKLQFQSIYTLGGDFKKTEVIGSNIKKFDSMETLYQSFKKDFSSWKHILIKGSRSMKMEKLIEFFQAD